MATRNLQSQQNTFGVFQIRRASLSVVTPAISGGSMSSSFYNALGGETLMGGTSIANSANKVAYLWGVGYGDRGYGMSTPLITTKSRGQSIKNTDWLNVQTALTNLIVWQDSTFAIIPPSTSFDTGDSIMASDANALAIAADIADSRRLSFLASNMTLVNNAATATRTGAWGSFPIACSFTFELPSENQMRYFFNSGGDIRFSFNHPDTSSTRNARWADIMNSLIVAFTANRTIQIDGAKYPGIDKDIGYYQLTESWQTIYDGTNLSAYALNSNDITIEARSTFIGGLNGGKGRVIEFRVTIVDDSGLTQDLIATGTSVSLSHLRATTTIVIPNPTCTVTEPL